MYSAIDIGPAMAIKRRIAFSSGERSSAMFGNRLAGQGKAEHGDAGQYQRNAEQHPHGEAAPEKAELRVRLAKKFADNAGDTITEKESSGDDTGPLERTHAEQQSKHDEQDQAFEHRFVELAGMARDR